MSDATGIRIRVLDSVKAEWQARARADGTSLSHLMRTAARLAMLAGPRRVKETVATIDAMRRDLHAVAMDLHKIAEGNTAFRPDEVRAALARAHEAAEATSAFLRRR